MQRNIVLKTTIEREWFSKKIKNNGELFEL